MQRIKSIDFLRGLVMILMPLDHVRDFLSNSLFSPTDLQHTTIALFFTRAVVNFCAPVFIFLAGLSMFILKSRGKTTKEISFFLFTRGLLLILFELTIIRTVWTFNFDLSFELLQIFWAIGCCMIALSGIIFLPYTLIGILSIVILISSDFFSMINIASIGSFSWIYKILFGPGEAQIHLFKNITLQIEDPIFAWIGVISLGLVMGKIFIFEPIKRKKMILLSASLFTIIFIIVRYFNFYGNPAPWAVQKNLIFTFMSFINAEKYPPSFDYIMLYLAIAFWVLWIMDKKDNKVTSFFITYGKVPLSYYIMHVFLIHLVAVILAYITYGKANWLFDNHALIGGITDAFPQGYGYNLPTLYFIWIIVILLLYPFCRWYGSVKQKYKHLKFLKYI